MEMITESAYDPRQHGKGNRSMISPVRSLSVLIVAILALSEVCVAQEAGYHFRVESNLRAGVAKVDITPPPDTPVVGHVRPTSGVRDPIRAGVLLLD
jgi:neutral ceramidase